jgi:hypothetical protein
MIRFDLQGFSYTFKTDDKEFPAPDGSMNTWKAIGPDQWDVTSKLNGKVVALYSLTAKIPALSVELSATGADGITWKDDTGFTCSAKFDGKDYQAVLTDNGAPVSAPQEKVKAVYDRQ